MIKIQPRREWGEFVGTYRNFKFFLNVNIHECVALFESCRDSRNLMMSVSKTGDKHKAFLSYHIHRWRDTSDALRGDLLYVQYMKFQ